VKTARELVAELNASKVYCAGAVGGELDMDSVAEVETIDRDEHRWYTLGTVVYRVGDEFFGVRGLVSLRSDSAQWEDIGLTCIAFEMEQVPSVTYRKKPDVDSAHDAPKETP